MLSFKIVAIGSSAGLVLDTEAMSHLKLRTGDTVYLTEAPGSGYRLTPFHPDFERQLALAEQIMREDGDILSALAH